MMHNLRKLGYMVLLIFGFAEISAQVQLERQVISNMGTDQTGTSIGIFSTVGEMIVSTENTSNNIYTQGFQQDLTVDSTISFVLVWVVDHS